jgi:hypothetical protein
VSDGPDDPHRRAKRPGESGERGPAGPAGGEGYPPPMFAPAAPAPEGAPPPSGAAAAPAPTEEGAPPPGVAPAASAAAPAAPAAPSVVSGEIDAGTAASGRVSFAAVKPATAAATPAATPATAAATPATAAATPVDEQPLLPARYSESDLRSAVSSPATFEHFQSRGGRAHDDDDDDDGGGDDRAPRSRKTVIAMGAGLIAALGIATLIVLGRINAGRYAVSCNTKLATAEHGRSFPPWGMSRLGGDPWKPIPIPPSFQCVGLETEDPAELGDAYRKMLVERAESVLTAKEKEPAQIDLAAGMLEQALLHARSDSDQHKSARQVIQRMHGDVAYWRASAALQKATTELAEAAKQFESAAGQLPRFVSDASAWATHVRRLVDELRGGPAGAKPLASAPATAAAAPTRPLAPAGVALPVQPGASGGSGSPGAGSGSAPQPAPVPPGPPDAGVPTGGVLL